MSESGASKAMQRYETITGRGERLPFPQQEGRGDEGDHDLGPTEPDSSVRLGEALLNAAQGPADFFTAATGGDGLSAAVNKKEGTRFVG